MQSFMVASQLLNEAAHLLQGCRQLHCRNASNYATSFTLTGPGREIAEAGIKNMYVRRRRSCAFYSISLFSLSRLHAADFAKSTGLSLSAFEEIRCIASIEIWRPLNPYLEFTGD